ncbi:MAG: hypothetical protein JSS50_00430 [Proteobacteria bacterium]|nr:hypothetical protein [Pseudomonadota bacterium]
MLEKQFLRHELDTTEKRIVMRAGQKWLLKCEKNKCLLRLNALEAGIEALNIYDKRMVYEPATVFDQLYRKFKHKLFLDYCSTLYGLYSASLGHELNYPKSPSLKPAGHHFTKSAALWEYGLEKFGLNANAKDHDNNNALMAAIKEREFSGAIAVLSNIKSAHNRKSLVGQQNRQGHSVTKLVSLVPKTLWDESYQQLILLIRKHIDRG